MDRWYRFTTMAKDGQRDMHKYKHITMQFIGVGLNPTLTPHQ